MTKLRINVQSKGSTKRIPLTSPKQHSFDHSRDRKSSTLKLPGAAGEKRKHHPVHGNPLKWKSPLKWLNREAEMSEGWIGWSSPYSRKKRNGRGQGSLQSVLVAVIGAVLLGTLLGLSIMALFFSGDGTDISARSIDSHLQSVPVDEKEKESEVNHKKKVSNSKSNGYRLPELKAVLVQTGTFKKKSGALKTVREYRSEGSGAVITENSPYRIYPGDRPESGGSESFVCWVKGKEVLFKGTPYCRPTCSCIPFTKRKKKKRANRPDPKRSPCLSDHGGKNIRWSPEKCFACLFSIRME